MPANLVDYRDRVGHTLSFVISGSTRGTVWGTNIYSDDSHLSAAAVHAGVVRVGEMKSVQVQILPGMSGYQASIRNGVTSSFYGAWEGSYVFVDTPDNAPTIVPNLQIYRAELGQNLAFMITGSTGGNVWGTDVYTDDSNLAVAAVHAGVIANGQTKIVHIQAGPGQSAFQGSTNNGVASMNFDVWPGSFSFTNSRELFRAETATVKSYRARIGQVISFVVTGGSVGSIWGSGMYTDDSDIGVAAVHAGLVKVGETRTLAVHILPGQLKYEGSAANGIISGRYGIWGGSFTFLTMDSHNHADGVDD